MSFGGFLSDGRELPHSMSWRKSKVSLLSRGKCVKALRCHQMSLEAVLYQRIRSVHVTAMSWYNWDSATFYTVSWRGVDNEWVVWMKVISKNKTAAHQWNFFCSFLFLFFSPGCHWTKFYCLRKNCKLRTGDPAQKTVNTLTWMQALCCDGQLSWPLYNRFPFFSWSLYCSHC